MGIYADVTGNLLSHPEQRKVTVRGEDRTITEIRVMADYYKRDADGNLIQDDEKTVPVNITIWHERLGKEVMKHFRTGARVIASGDLTQEEFKSRETGETRHTLHLSAESVALVPYRIDKIEFTSRNRETPDSDK
jgi:single-strand DNA-binding protein